jgi:YVTN family beta-propeller protein
VTNEAIRTLGESRARLGEEDGTPVVTAMAADHAIKVGRDPLSLAAAPDGGRVYVASIRDDMASVIRTATNTVSPKRTRTGKSPASIAITPDGQRLYIDGGRAWGAA